MRIHITSDTSLHQIQNEFHAAFPYLKIEFYKVPHGDGEGSLETNKLNHDLKISSLEDAEIEGVFEFDENITVSEFEQYVLTFFGLAVQVFRKSGNNWLQTIRTDDWTLEAQNEEGASTLQRNPSEEPDDYHEQE